MLNITNTNEIEKIIKRLKKSKVNSYSNQGSIFKINNKNYNIEDELIRAEFTSKLLRII